MCCRLVCVVVRCLYLFGVVGAIVCLVCVVCLLLGVVVVCGLLVSLFVACC